MEHPSLDLWVPDDFFAGDGNGGPMAWEELDIDLAIDAAEGERRQGLLLVKPLLTVAEARLRFLRPFNPSKLRAIGMMGRQALADYVLERDELFSHNFHGTTSKDCQLLVLAAKRGSRELLLWVVDYLIRDDFWRVEVLTWALPIAVEERHLDLAEILIERGANIKDPWMFQYHSFRLRRDSLEHLLHLGADIDAVGGQYGNSLTAAYVLSDIAPVKFLLSLGANVNLIGVKGSFLELALDGGERRNGSMETVKLALRYGADPNIYKFHNPLAKAIKRGLYEIVDIMLAKGARVDSENKPGSDDTHPLTCAARRANLGLMKRLLVMGSPHDARCRALEYAALHLNECRRMVKVLLSHDTCGRLRRSDGMSKALTSVVAKRDHALVDFLLAEIAIYDSALLDTRTGAQNTNTDEMEPHDQDNMSAMTFSSSTDCRAREGEIILQALDAAIKTADMVITKALLHYIQVQNLPVPCDLDHCVFVAACGPSEAMVKLFLELGGSANATGPSPTDVKRPVSITQSAISAAARIGNMEIIRLLLDHGADPNLDRGPACEPALYAAVYHGHQGIAELLIAAGAKINALSAPRGFETCKQFEKCCSATALSIACRICKDEMVEMLLAHGADVNLEDEQRLYTPLRGAIEGYRETLLVRRLIEGAGADINAVSLEGHDAISLALCGDWAVIFEYLLKRPELNLQASPAPRILAQRSDKFSTWAIRKLLDHGFDVNATYDHETLLVMAARSSEDHVQSMSVLLNRGANVNAQCGPHLNTALQYAASQGHFDKVKLLLSEKKIDVNLVSHELGSALHAAKIQSGREDCDRFPEIVEALEAKGAVAMGSTCAETASCVHDHSSR